MKSALEYQYHAKRPTRTWRLNRIACLRDNRWGHLTQCRRYARVSKVPSMLLKRAPRTSVQYRKPCNAKTIIDPESTTDLIVSIRDSNLKRSSFWRRDEGMDWKEATIKPRLITAITRGKSGESKKRPSADATAQEMAAPTAPRQTDRPFS